MTSRNIIYCYIQSFFIMRWLSSFAYVRSNHLSQSICKRFNVFVGTYSLDVFYKIGLSHGINRLKWIYPNTSLRLHPYIKLTLPRGQI